MGDPSVGGPGFWRGTRTPLLVWGGLVVAASLVGVPIRRQVKVGAPPLTGGLSVPIVPLVAVALALGLWLARRLPGWCARLSWRRLLLVAALVALGWGMALAMVRGPSGLDRGLTTRFEYPAVVAQVDRVGVGPFVDTFTDPDTLARYPIHVQGHPLGAALLFVGLDRVGLGGAGGGALFLLVIGTATVPAVLVAVREVAGERRARQAAPFLVLLPAVIWTVTSADALYAAVGAWAVTLVILATADRAAPAARAGLGLAGGVLFGLGMYLSYGLPPLALVAVVVAVSRRRWSVLGWAAVGGGVVVAAWTAGGFWWFDGLAATHARYLAGVAPRRPYPYFALLGNPAAFAIALGPAVAVALARVRDRRLWLLAGGALAAVAVADLSGLSKAEVERIWLPFVPWIAVLCAGLADVGRRGIDLPAVTYPTASDAAPNEPAPNDPATSIGSLPSATKPAPVSSSWSALAQHLLVVQVVVAVVVESLVRTLW